MPSASFFLCPPHYGAISMWGSNLSSLIVFILYWKNIMIVRPNDLHSIVRLFKLKLLDFLATTFSICGYNDQC